MEDIDSNNPRAKRMPNIEIYTSPLCGYCYRAKKLLAGKGVAFNEINVLGNSQMLEKMTRRAGGDHKVPQIFIDGEYVGGSDELEALDKSGKLDGILQTGV